MIIQKSTMSVGQYVAHQRLADGRWMAGIGNTHTSAMLDLFKITNWLIPFPHQAVEDLEAQTEY